MPRLLLLATLLIALGATACTPSPRDDGVVPTLASFETLPTARFLTQNAPPPGFGEVAFDPIDLHLSDRPGWTYTVSGTFEGTFDDTGQPAEGRLAVEVQSNELGQSRRVVLDVEGGAFLSNEALLRLEGVRWSNDYYMVDVNGRCSIDRGGVTGEAAIADLSAGQLIGGVRRAVPTGHRLEIGGTPAWQYTFAPEDARLPAVLRAADSTVALQADLWIAPSINAVLRYEVTATVGRVHLLWADQAASSSVSGTLYLRYELDLSALDVQPNISVPHGC